jgi:acetyl esterase/lipase
LKEKVMLFARKGTALAVGACLLCSTAFGRHAYTVDDMLRLEEIGKVRFDAAGQHVIFERYGPFDAQSSYARSIIRGELRSKVYIASLDEPGDPQPLFKQNPADGYTLNSVSPDGAYIVFDHTSAHAFAEGVTTLAGQQTREFAFSPTYSDTIDARWIANRMLTYSALRSGDYPLPFAMRTERIALLESKWRASREGKVTTASEIGSGRYEAFAGYGQSLVIGDAADGTSRTVGPGRYDFEFASSDGQVLAALREDRLRIDPQRPIEHGANMESIMRTLLVYDLTRGDRPALEPCAGYDILQASLNWSPGGRYLAFVAREPGQTWANPGFWVFDRHTGHASRQQLGELKPHLGRSGSLTVDVRSAWIGEKLAVLLDRPSAGRPGQSAREVRADWYLLGGDKPRNLTGPFIGETPVLIATSRDAAILLDAGKAWAVDASGRRRDLTASLPGPVVEWREPSRFGTLPYFDLQPVATLVLQSKADAPEPRTLFFVNLTTGAIDRVTAPSAASEPVAVAAASRKAAFLDSSSNATVLSVAGVSGPVRQIVTINEFLKDVVGGTALRVDHTSGNGQPLHSWLLLPPGATKGMKLPTVVNVYPGAGCSETFRKWSLHQVHALNDYLLSAHGYAVLFPCLPVNYEDVPRDPLDGLAERVLTVVDAAVGTGFVDPDRLAVQGQSYGGYTTGALVGLTNRFKSAIAQAGLYDLISSYGEFDQRLRLDIELTGPDLFAVSLAESSQLGMGAPPWKDPQRYLRNSPLMHVESINTPIMLINGDLDYVNTTQSEEFFTALTRLNKDAVYVRYYGEDHVFSSPANIRDMWRRIFAWYEKTLGPPAKVDVQDSP